MRQSLLAGLTAIFLVSLPTAGMAQVEVEDLKPRRPKIEKVRTGFVGGGITRQATAYGDFKSGAWTPIYVDVIAGSEPIEKGRIVIEGTDCDDVKNTYTVPLTPLERGEQRQVMGYTKMSAFDTEVNITLFNGNQRLAERKESASGLDMGHVLYLAVGSRLPGLVRALPKQQSVPIVLDPQEDNPQINEAQTDGRYVGYLDDVRQLPSRWFGYESADVVILLTGNRPFITDLQNDHEVNKDASRYAALAEWVRRGGRLIVFAGRNYDMVASLDARQPMLPVRLLGANPDADTTGFRSGEEPLPPGMHLTRFEAKAGQSIKVVPSQSTPVSKAIMVQGRHGMGHVTVVGFDPEQAPFIRWKGQTQFWKNRILDDPQAPRATVTSRYGRLQGGFGQVQFGGDEGNELGSQFQQSLEDFQDVPVVSFGYIALFILVYILIVGPLDYVFLKKVVKRLEWTWITFPIVVLVISTVAYFMAYRMKGKDQRVNKVDLVDIELIGKQAQVYGHSWFTIFSPRIQHYTVAVEPAADIGWAPREKTATVVSWLGRPDDSSRGSRRPRSQSLFRRTYEWEPDASGMKGVPIPVWSTKSFSADWASTEPMPAPFESDIQEINGKLTGRITSRLPVPLDDVILLWKSPRDGSLVQYAPLGSALVPNGERGVDNLFNSPNTQPSALTTWASQGPQSPAAPPRDGSPQPTYSSNSLTVTEFLFRRLLDNQSQRRNSGLRILDQSARVQQGGELVLLGRMYRTDGTAEEISTDKRSPTRLWLGQLPKAGETRPAMNGTLSQETFVRVFIPVPIRVEGKP